MVRRSLSAGATRLLERGAGAIALLRDPEGREALRRWRPRSVAAWRLVTGVRDRGLRPATVVDVGANAGQFARAAVEVFPGCVVHAFEPLPAAAAALRENLADHPEVHVHEAAAARAGGRIAFHPHEYTLASSALARDPDRGDDAWTGERPPIEVDAVRLDDAVPVDSLASPVLLKLDVQGYEAEALAGAPELLGRCEAVVVELALEPSYLGQPPAGQLVAGLAEQGWWLHALLDLRRDHRGRVAEVDGLFCRSAGGGPTTGDPTADGGPSDDPATGTPTPGGPTTGAPGPDGGS